MLNHTELVRLHRALQNERVLSVYVNGAAADPATHRAWRMHLDHEVHTVRQSLGGASRAERDDFERCVCALDAELGAYAGTVGAPGWVAFITASAIHGAGRVPVPVPTSVTWGIGPSIAPYARVLKETRPVIIGVVDAREAALHRYARGALEHVETLHAHHGMGRTGHMGSAPRRGFHSGTRGTAQRDAAQRAMSEGTERMLDRAAERIATLAGADGWIVLGGISRVVARMAVLLLPSVRERVLVSPVIDVHATDAELARVARVGASRLRDDAAMARLNEIIDRAQSDGSGALGLVAVDAALEQGTVRELYVTHRYLEQHRSEAETTVRAALEQGALVEEVERTAADRLDEWGGIAARLRFRPTKGGAAAHSTSSDIHVVATP